MNAETTRRPLRPAWARALTHVPFRGTGPLVTDLLGGHIKLGMSSITSVAPQIAAGKLKPYAMASLEHSSVAPSIPTFKELGRAMSTARSSTRCWLPPARHRRPSPG